MKKTSTQQDPSESTGQSPNTDTSKRQRGKPGDKKVHARMPTLNDAEDPPLVAAKGDDDLMSQIPQTKKTQPQPQQQPQANAGSDSVKAKWKQHVGAAKIAWGKLTDDELLETEGHTQKLAGLVQERYAITHEEANSQVENFVHKHRL